MSTRKPRRRNVVLLRALDGRGEVVEKHELSHDDYYEGVHEIIDSDEYRAARGIVRLEGRVFGPSGALEQEFDNRYSKEGQYAGGRAIHSDGTIIED